MPFVNIKIYEGHTRERKREMVKRITEVINELTGVPKDNIWVVIEDIPPADWSVGGKMGDDK